MKKRRTTPKPFHSTVAVALCYIIVLQAFLAGCGIALAVGQTSTSASAAICHGAGGNQPAGPPASELCTICTLTSAGALPAPEPVTVAAPRTASHGVVPLDIAALAKAAPARAGFARAHPLLVAMLGAAVITPAIAHVTLESSEAKL